MLFFYVLLDISLYIFVPEKKTDVVDFIHYPAAGNQVEAISCIRHNYNRTKCEEK